MPRRLLCALMLTFCLPPTSGGADITASLESGTLRATRRGNRIVVRGKIQESAFSSDSFRRASAERQ
jgi:hypothetical protein